MTQRVMPSVQKPYTIDLKIFKIKIYDYEKALLSHNIVVIGECCNGTKEKSKTNFFCNIQH
jgi:hypothetical protein